jgi:hypothetical protein
MATMPLGTCRPAMSARLNCAPDFNSIQHRTCEENDMVVDVIYRQADGTQTILGTRKLSHMPPAGEPFELDQRQYIARSYAGPDAHGR